MSDTMSNMEKLVETAAERAQAANNYDAVGLFLVQKGYSAAGAAGVCGCIAGESGGDPEAIEVPSDPESGGAGLIQWTPASSMEQYGGTCAAAGIGNNSVAVDLQNQMNAILAYNNAQGASNVAELNAQTDPVAAADFYSKEFERPVVPLSDVRPSVAQSVYAFLTGAATPVPGQEYMIQPGDTLFNIATAAYGAGNANAGVAAIETANPGINPNNLQVGHEIEIPVLGGTAPMPGQEYTIRAGDTLFNIATAAYGAGNANAGVTAIEAANLGINPNDLQVGQEIKIPVL